MNERICTLKDKILEFLLTKAFYLEPDIEREFYEYDILDIRKSITELSYEGEVLLDNEDGPGGRMVHITTEGKWTLKNEPYEEQFRKWSIQVKEEESVSIDKTKRELQEYIWKKWTFWIAVFGFGLALYGALNSTFNFSGPNKDLKSLESSIDSLRKELEEIKVLNDTDSVHFQN